MKVMLVETEAVRVCIVLVVVVSWGGVASRGGWGVYTI